MLTGASWSGTRALLQLMIIILMMITSFAAPATSEEDSGIERISRQVHLTESYFVIRLVCDYFVKYCLATTVYLFLQLCISSCIFAIKNQ